MSVSKRIGQNSKIKFSDLSNDDNNCVPKVIKKYTESTDNKDSISKNNHQSTQLFSTEKIIIDKNFKYKAFDKDSMNAKKRYKTVNESAQIGNNLKKSNTKQSKIKSVDNNDLKLCLNNNNAQTSTKNSDEIETIQNYPDFNKNIAGNKLSILSRDMSGKMIKLNNDSNDFGVKNDVTENSEPSNKKKMSAIEGLKLFGGESVLEQWNNFLKCKVIEWFKKQEKPIKDNAQKLEMWIEKFTSISHEIEIVSNEYQKIFGNSQVNGNSLQENVLMSYEKCNKSLDTNKINIGKKLSINPSTSKELMISTTKVISPSTLNPPTIINTDCIDLTESDGENEHLNVPVEISNSKAFSKEPNSYLQPRTLLPINFVQAINPNQFQFSTSNVTNHCIPYQLLNCQIIQPQLTDQLKILVPHTEHQSVTPSPPKSLAISLRSWKRMIPSRLQLFLSKRLTSNKIKIAWNYVSKFNDSSFARITNFQIYMYPGIKNSNEWEYLSELDAFPMNCIISRFDSDKEHYFMVRAKDEYGRFGPFSLPLLV